MLTFLKKKNDTDAPVVVEKPPVALGGPEVPFHDFLPYFAHYNAHTLLTKNGELMQTIRIASNAAGLDYEGGSGTKDKTRTVRDLLRQAIGTHVKADNFSIWIHTIRKSSPIHYEGQHAEPFAAYVHKQWQQQHPWKNQYHNEIYVSILHEGQSTHMLDQKNLRQIVLAPSNRRFRHAYLEEAQVALDQTMDAILQHLRPYYNAQRLSVVERMHSTTHRTGFYSEPMEFLCYLFNLRTQEMPVTETDISKAIYNSALTFGFNALETNHAGKKRFGAILTLKQYRELPGETVDRMLQAPMEFIITQGFHYIPAGDALKQYKEQKELFEVSGDIYAIRASGIEDMLMSNKKRPTDFGEQQTSILVLADEFKQIDPELARVQDAFPELGLVTIREDIKLEDSFWAIFPGNFEFMRRRTPINTSRIGGFCRLNRFPNGIEHNNHWGSAVTLIPTMVNSPYFFNFHVQDNGHTVMFDFNSFNDHGGNILLNFLLDEMRKFGGRLTVFDRNRSAQLFFSKLGGKYHTFPVMTMDNRGVIIETAETKLKLNPFSLEPTPRNLSFLLAWCNSLISPDVKLPDTQRAHLQTAIEALYASPPEDRHLEALVAQLAPIDAPLAQAFAPWYGHGRLAGLVDASEETLDLREPLNAFDMNNEVRDPECVIAVFSYLLHRVISAIDGQPSIIVLHDAWGLLENPFFAPRLESLLEMFRQNNVMVICTTGKPADVVGTHILPTLMQNCATFLYVPDDLLLDYAGQPTQEGTLGQALQLSEHDAGLLRRMERQKGDFLLRHRHESVALRVNLTTMHDIHAIFSNDSKNLHASAEEAAAAQKAKNKHKRLK